MSDQRSMTVDDGLLVLWSAETLEISEFELFELAYRAWFREEPDVSRLERIFAAYMFDEAVPFWVRQFARATLDENDGWRREDDAEVGAFLAMRFRTISIAASCTAVLALSLFLPHVVFPWIDTDYSAFPA